MTARRLAALLLAAALLPTGGPREVRAVPAPPPLPANSWPMHGGTPARNMVNSQAHDLPSSWSVDPKRMVNVRWGTLLGSHNYGAPVVVNGRVFVGTNNVNPRNPRDRGKPTEEDPDGPPVDKSVLMCFGARDGKFLWQAAHDKLPRGSHEGIRSSPAVDGDRVYYVNNRDEVVCADANGLADGNQGVMDEPFQERTDADIIWRFDMARDLKIHTARPYCPASPFFACSPLLVGERLFIITGNGVDAEHIDLPSPDAPSFIALDKQTGKLLWQSNLPGKNILNGQWSSPAYGVFGGVPAVIFPGGDGWLYGLKPESGALLWKFDANPKGAIFARQAGARLWKFNAAAMRAIFPKVGPETKADIMAMPVVYKEKIYIGTGPSPGYEPRVGHFWCIDPAGKSGDISPELVTDGKVTPNRNSGAVWHYGGNETRQFADHDWVFGRTLSTACIVDNVLYIAEMDGYLHCLDARTGKKFWQFDLRAEVWGSAYYADGRVFLGTDDGDLFVFKHDPRPEVLDEVAEVAKAPDEKRAKLRRQEVRKEVAKHSLLAQIDMGTPIRSTPSAAGRVLYVTTESHLYAIEARK